MAIGINGARRTVGASCSQAGAGIYECFPDWVKDNPRAKYEFASCVWDSAGWWELLYDGRVQACSLWLSTFDSAVLADSFEEGWNGTAAERERIKSKLITTATTEQGKLGAALEEAQRTGDAEMEADALEQIAYLDHLIDSANEELPADFFYFHGSAAGEATADAVDAVAELGSKAKDLVLEAGSKLLWWTVGIVAGVGAVWASVYAFTSAKARRKSKG